MDMNGFDTIFGDDFSKAIFGDNFSERLNKAIKYDEYNHQLVRKCLICSEPITLSEYEESLITCCRDNEIRPKICDKCRNAILKIRKE